jgi:hypothetical protein
VAATPGAAAAAAPSPPATPLPSEIQAASESPSPDPTARPAAPAAGGSAAPGWGGGWGLGALGGLGNRLQQVALGAVKDIKEITETLQQVRQDPCTDAWYTSSSPTQAVGCLPFVTSRLTLVHTSAIGTQPLLKQLLLGLAHPCVSHGITLSNLWFAVTCSSPCTTLPQQRQ